MIATVSHRFVLRSALAAVAALALATRPAAAEDFIKFLPDDTNAVVVLNANKLLDSALAKKHTGGKSLLDLVKEVSAAVPGADKFWAEEGTGGLVEELLTDTKRLVVAVSSKSPDKPLFLFEGKFDAAKISKGFTAIAKLAGGKVETIKIGDEDVLVFEGGPKPVLVSVVTDTIMVLTDDKAVIEDAIAKANGKKEGKLPKDVAALVESAPALNAIWVVGADETQGVSGRGSISVTEDIKVELVLNLKDEEMAKQIEEGVKGMSGQLPPDLPKPAADAAKSVTATREGKTVTIKATITGEQFDEMLKLIPKKG
jgi:hypothetical protein